MKFSRNMFCYLGLHCPGLFFELFCPFAIIVKKFWYAGWKHSISTLNYILLWSEIQCDLKPTLFVISEINCEKLLQNGNHNEFLLNVYRVEKTEFIVGRKYYCKNYLMFQWLEANELLFQVNTTWNMIRMEQNCSVFTHITK